MKERKRESLLSEMADTRLQILTSADHLPAAAHDLAYLGQWSVQDLIAHLEGWDWLNLGAIEEVRHGGLPTFYGAHDRDWSTLNRYLVAECKAGAVADQIRSARRSHQGLMEAVRALDPHEIDRDFGVRFRGIRVTIERLLRWELGDERTHLEQLRRFGAEVGGRRDNG